MLTYSILSKNRANRKLFRSTQVACHLALNVVIQRPGMAQLIPIPLVRLTGFLFAAWLLLNQLNRVVAEILALSNDAKAAFVFSSTVLIIGFNALAFGLGVVR